MIGRDGRSNVPAGIVDYAAGADDIRLDPETQARLDRLFSSEGLDDIKAKYKLEIVVNEERTAMKPYFGLVTAWTNGGLLHGGGDGGIYFCSNLVEKDGHTKTCSAPLDLRWIGRKNAVCPTCRRMVDVKELAGQVGYRATSQVWAGIIARMWLALGGDADLRLGVLGDSLRRKTDDVVKNAAPTAGDKLNYVRHKRLWIVYPLKNLIKDISAGAGLEQRIRAFLSA